ncbi:MAG: SDR family oxidoreductase [Planctomycetes bacterium]|nr:SDR family oxidoreductase [Planctomycetota bacterium]
MRHRLAIAVLFVLAAAPAQEPQTEQQRAVLVTGASSGIGRKTTELLADNGFFVYAGARKAEDLAALDAIANVQGVRLDVTSQADIDAAVETVRDGGRGLWGLINNAGVVVLGPLIELREQDLTFQFDVNVYGPYRVTKAFAPLLIESRGRVATTGSISGHVTWAMGGAYTMSKHAVEAFSDTLAAELQPFGVAVTVVDPGNFKTRIMTSMRERLEASGYTTEGSRYRERLDRMLDRATDRTAFPEPDAVAAAFLAALTVDRPQRRYMVTPNRREADLTLRAAFDRIAQLNGTGADALGRDQLVEMLDAALQREREAR